MTKSVEEFAEDYDEWAPEYDEDNDFEEREECLSLVVEHAAPGPEDTVLDLGTGTGAVALALADDAGRVLGRDVSEAMLAEARANAAARGVENAEFERGRFREPNVEAADVVVTNFALHHFDDEAKRAAIDAIAELGPRRVVFGEAMYFGECDPEDPLFDPESVYPATVGFLVEALTGAGFAVTAARRVHEEAGVLAAERPGGT